jgi:hypothetical protein
LPVKDFLHDLNGPPEQHLILLRAPSRAGHKVVNLCD